MKFLKLTFALTACLTLWAASSQAQIPVTFALQASYSHGSQGAIVTINNAAILSKVASYLGIKLPGTSLAVNTNGNLVILDANKNIVVDLSVGTNTSTSTIVFVPSRGIYVTNVTSGAVQASTFFFYDPIWSGTETSNNLFSVTGKAIATGGDDDDFSISFSSSMVSHNKNGNTSTTTFASESYELADGAKASINVALNSLGVYTLGFTINASGLCSTSAQPGEGYVSGTITAKGTQTGGSSFLDPFNGFGNYDTDYEDDFNFF
jgi:hypothetical protein